MDGAPILQPPNNMPKKLNDCYFFYYSTCKNGDLCPFRHETSALGCEITCLFWKQGKCMNPSCNLRHMELKDRKMIQCYWEDQPTGCQKAHCPFRHKNPKFSSLDLTNAGLLNQNLINSTTYQDLNASALSELSAVLGTSALGLDGNLLLPLATGLTSTLLSDVTTQTLIHVKEPKLNSKQKEIDKIRMEKVLEKAKEIERQISSLEGGSGGGDSAATNASDDKNSSKKDQSSLKKSSSGDEKSKRTTRSRTRSRSRSRNRSRSSHRHHRSSRSPTTSSSSHHHRSSRRHRRSSRSRSRSRRRHRRSRSRSRSHSRSRKHSRKTRSSSRGRSSPHKKKSMSMTSSSSAAAAAAAAFNKDHSDTKVSSTSSSTSLPTTTTKQSSSSSGSNMMTTTSTTPTTVGSMTSNSNGSD